MPWTATDLLADVRRRAMLPSATTLGTTDADLLLHADNEMASRLVPLVMSVNEEFYVQTIDVATSSQSAYRIPNRSAGGKLRDVVFLSGNAQIPLARIEPERLHEWTVNATGQPAGFYLEAGAVNLVPKPSGGGILRMRYFVRPGRLTATAGQYGTITAVAYSGNTVNVTCPGFAVTAGALYDIIAARPPFEYLLTDGVSSGTGTGSAILTVSSPTTPAPGLSPNIQVGDIIAQRDVSPLMQLPVEMHSLLAQRVVCAVMEAMGYGERLEMAEAAYARLEAAALKMISPRVDGAPRKMRGVMGFGRNLGIGWFK